MENSHCSVTLYRILLAGFGSIGSGGWAERKTKLCSQETSLMDDADRKLINEIQTRFPISQRPFRDLGVRLGCSEDEILRRIRKLKERDIIRRIGGSFDSKRLGFATTLCAAKVANSELSRFVEVVNGFPEVTHNYLRDHPFNVWFTFVARDQGLIEDYIKEIRERTGVREILNLPAVKTFKILVDFDIG